jgi:hypothetical protein
MLAWMAAYDAPASNSIDSGFDYWLVSVDRVDYTVIIGNDYGHTVVASLCFNSWIVNSTLFYGLI